MRRASLTGISPWSTGSWEIRPGEIELLRPEDKGRKRRGTITDISRFKPGRAAIPLGGKTSPDGLIISLGVMAGFIIGGLIFFTLI